ncbi:MAG: hypothetical protein MR332_13735 [Fusicatenibacter sp.]|nr:hypothetical protein [Fusicatenibacter sp.]
MLNGQVKTSIIGGASITWMPTFINDLSNCESMLGGEICLYDIDQEHLEIIHQFAEKLMNEKKKDIRLKLVDTLEEALTGADFVVCTVLIGTHEVWKDEMNIIHKYGIEHPKGMSVGPGGLAMALKQIPWIVALAKRMEELCPNAWLLNLSNPMQAISLAVERYSSIKYLGLCHGVTNTISRMMYLIGEDESKVNYTIGGVNHFEIITKIEKDGEDLLEKVAQAYEKIQREKGHSGERVTTEIYRLFDGYPCNEDIHVIEFLPYYIQKGRHLEEFELTHNYIENRIKGRDARWQEIRDYIDGKKERQEVVEEHSSEKLAEIIDAVCNNKPAYMYANVTNKGYISNLPESLCVEVPVIIHRNRYEGVCVGEMPKALAALSTVHGAVQDLTVDAAMNGDRHAALQALSLDPMCYTLSLEERSNLLDELIANSAQYMHDGFRKGE